MLVNRNKCGWNYRDGYEMPLDVSEGAEVIDVCKAVEEMMNESEERGELRMLVKQVRRGRITIEQAAEDANMSVEQFKRVMDDTPLQAV